MRNRLMVAVAIPIACLLAIGVAACGGGDDSTSADATTADVHGTVTVWDFEYESFPEYTESADKLDAEFEREYPDVTVERIGVPFESFEPTYKAAFTAREGPDVMTMSPGESGVLSYDQGLEPLNDRIPAEMEENMIPWPSVTPGLKREGDRYGIPVGLQGWVFYYNKKMFKEAGLPTDFQPETWEELREAGEKLKVAGTQPFFEGNEGGLQNSFWFSIGFQSQNSEDEITELAEGEMAFTDETVTRAFDPVFEMYEADLFPSDWFSIPFAPEGYAGFGEEKSAMVLGFWSTTGYWGEYNPELGEENVGMFFPPGDNPVATTTGFALSIPTFADNKDAAWALLEFYGSKHANEVLFDVGGQLPVRRDVTLPADAPQQAVDLVEAAKEPGGIVLPFAAIQSNIAYVTMPAEISQALQGRTSLEDAQAAIQETYEKGK